MLRIIVATLFLTVQSVFAAEPSDLFSRANCYHNESITYNYFDPPEHRAVFSYHSENGTLKHYVTPNPAVISSCLYVGSGDAMVSGYWCLHYTTLNDRHAGIHGDSFLTTEPNPDGDLSPPGCGAPPGRWTVNGVHSTTVPGIGQVVTFTEATDCNFHFDQFY